MAQRGQADMADIPQQFRALVATQHGAAVSRKVATVDAQELPEADVTIRVRWSSVNYKDALAGAADGKVAQISPLIPGIDLAGEVIEDGTGSLRRGQTAIAHGYGLGVSHHGG